MEGLLTKIAIALHIMSPAVQELPKKSNPVETPAKQKKFYCEESSPRTPSTARVYWTDAYYAQEDEENGRSAAPDHKG